MQSLTSRCPAGVFTLQDWQASLQLVLPGQRGLKLLDPPQGDSGALAGVESLQVFQSLELPQSDVAHVLQAPKAQSLQRGQSAEGAESFIAQGQVSNREVSKRFHLAHV